MIDEITMKIHGDEIILAALKEDVTGEDLSTNCVLREKCMGEAELLCKQDGVIAGLFVFARTFKLLDPEVEIKFFAEDGQDVKKGQKLAVVRGDMRAILTGERTALNFLQRMSGIATATRRTSKLLEGTSLRLADTRKTTPGLRLFEKYAVRAGGGVNHRYNLSDAIMLKDNHIGAAGGVKQAIAAAKAYASFMTKIEVETETVEQAAEAAEAGADVIMLDNMSDEEMRRAVKVIGGRALVEISGNVTEENIERLKNIGADIVSSGAITHSAPILDVSLKNLHAI